MTAKIDDDDGRNQANLSRGELVHLKLLEAIRSGAFAPGDRLREADVAGLAAQHAAESQIATLNDIIAQADDTTAADERAELNQIFHQYIYAAAHNRYLLQALNTLRDSIALLPSTTYALEGRHREAQAEHRQIVDAIGARDPQAAEAVARHHIGESEKARLKMVIALEREQKHDKEGSH